jgi:hypothetical protein
MFFSQGAWFDIWVWCRPVDMRSSFMLNSPATVSFLSVSSGWTVRVCLDSSPGLPNQFFGRWLVLPVPFGLEPKDRNHANILVTPFSFRARALARPRRQNPSPNIWRANFGGAGWGTIQTAPMWRCCEVAYCCLFFWQSVRPSIHNPQQQYKKDCKKILEPPSYVSKHSNESKTRCHCRPELIEAG